jgi:hypothetical protein
MSVAGVVFLSAKMRRLLIIISVVCLLLLVASFFVKPGIMMFARRQLGNIFVQSQVSVQGCSFRPHAELRLFGIEILRKGNYDIKIKEASVKYDLFTLLKAGSLKLTLKEASIFVNTPKKGIRDLAGYLKLGSGRRPIFGYVRVSDFSLDLNTQDTSAKAVLSSQINISTQSVDYLDFRLGNLNMSGVQLEDASFKLEPESGQGNFNLSRIKYDKLSITDIKGALKLEGKELLLSGVQAKALGGDLRGDLTLKIDKEAQYMARLECLGLDIERFVQDFNLREKFDMTGRLKGELRLEGKASHFEILKGDFSILEPGGTLIIKDTKFLENMAHSTKQPLELLVESFKNYGYNMGLITLGIEESSIILKVDLEGNTGKRNLSVALHNVKLGRE